MPKILSRYIFVEILGYFLISLFSFTGILLTLRLVKLAGYVINRGVDLGQVAMIFLAVIPTFLEIALPLATLLGVLLAFSRLSGDSEVIVMKGSGISLTALLPMIAVFGLLVTAGGIYVAHTLRPWGYRTLNLGLFEIAKRKSTAGLEQGIFNELGSITMYAQTIDHESGYLQRVLIDDRRDENARRLIIAKRGSSEAKPEEDAIIIKLEDGVIHEQSGNKYVTTKFVHNDLLLGPDELYGESNDERNRKNAELETHELRLMHDNLAGLPRSGDEEAQKLMREAAAAFLPLNDAQAMTFSDVRKRLAKVDLENLRRSALPVASLLLAFLGMALGIQPSRAQQSWGPTVSLGLGMGMFIIYYVLFSLSTTFAEQGSIPPTIAVWIPNVCVCLLTTWILRNICIERWSSVSEALIAKWPRSLRRKEATAS